ncbi:HET-domain-containing protein, partial [Trematosphaeria pertusa]
LKAIDCEERKVVRAPGDCNFVALSYVWGDSSTISPFSGVILPQNLPATIEDSIQVARQLGYRFLWVDRYCIDQSDTQAKLDQIQQMGQIYGSAALTMIAATGTDPTHGLPGISAGLAQSDPPKVRVGSLTVMHYDVPAALELSSSTWATRAWTYQESYLSKRRLVFTDNRVFMLCN